MGKRRYGTRQTGKGKGLQRINIHAEQVPFHNVIGRHIDLGQGHLLPDGVPVLLRTDKGRAQVVVKFKDGMRELGVVIEDEHQRKPLQGLEHIGPVVTHKMHDGEDAQPDFCHLEAYTQGRGQIGKSIVDILIEYRVHRFSKTCIRLHNVYQLVLISE
ncbi:hypothetical protein MTsPCn9_21460 [Croceitalea sp. MTPC9]|nr:hypothetical protein MTsPCn6_24800 [Croceitalea sp. MTPC6]GMN17210.1 hypothetical protein MTsPCn9_21460 [Croceitalea sp. MTPC9]